MLPLVLTNPRKLKQFTLTAIKPQLIKALADLKAGAADENVNDAINSCSS